MKKLKTLIAGAVVCAAVGVVRATPVMGTNTWVGPLPSTWNDASNWKSVNSFGKPMKDPLETFNKDSYHGVVRDERQRAKVRIAP